MRLFPVDALSHMARSLAVLRGARGGRYLSRTCFCLLGALMSLSAAAPQAQAPREWPTYPVKEAPAELRPAIQHGDLILISLQSAMQS